MFTLSRHYLRILLACLGLAVLVAAPLRGEDENDPEKAKKAAEKVEFDAFKKLMKEGNDGNPEAQAKLGTVFFNGGLGQQQDQKLAVFWYQKAADQKHVLANFNLGLCYDKGLGVAADPVQALKYYQAQLNAAVTFRDVESVRDMKQAAAYFKMAADQGNLLCQREYGRMLLAGDGVPSKPEEAVRYITQAAKAGDTAAQLLAADIYAGRYLTVARDDAKMVDFLWQAATNNEPEALAKIGFCYEEGIGLPRDQTLAIKWYTKGADLGSPEAMVNLGSCYSQGKGGLARDDKVAVKWYERGAEQNYPLAWHNLGIAYLTGRGVKEDPVKAAEYFEKAAKANLPSAQYHLSVMYERGMGVPENPELAYFWCHKAALQGDTDAYVDLGYYYLTGNGVKSDMTESKKWFTRAAERQHPEGKRALKELFNN